MRRILHRVVAPLLRRLLDTLDRVPCRFANDTGGEE